MLDKLGGRKVLVAIIITLIAVGLVFLKGDVPANFKDLLVVIFGAFVAGNMFEHASDAYTSAKAAAPENPPVDLSEVKAGLAKNIEATTTVQQTLASIINWLNSRNQPQK